MLKLTAIVSLMLIATWSHAESRRHKKDASNSGDSEPGSTLWAAGLSCDSCGSECTSACGTRHFRSCCFNYLRRKRGEGVQFWAPLHDMKAGNDLKSKLPVFYVDTDPEWMANFLSADFKPYPFADMVENRQLGYDA